MDHPLSLDSSPAERRALKFKVFTFYGKWEPQKSVADVNDLCEWALSNGVKVFNDKLRLKYGEDLSNISVNSYLDLPIETQLKLFYSEFDPRKSAMEIDNMALFARQNGQNGITELNMRMNQKYGENLNSLAFGGRVHMRVILNAYFRKVDPLRCTPENFNVTIDYVVINGALALTRELLERYKVPLQLSVNEIEGRAHEIEVDPQRAEALGSARPAVMSLMRGQQPERSVRPLSMALAKNPTVANTVAGSMTVSEDAEIKGLMEVFYAKNNPEKLASGGVDALMKYCRVYGLDSVNMKLREKYDEDLNDLKLQYSQLVEELTSYYGEVDPTKKNIEDIAAWAIVHGKTPLSDRLFKRYGKHIIDATKEPEVAAPAPAPVAEASPKAAAAVAPPTPAILAMSPRNSPVDSEVLRAKLVVFYKKFDSKPKSNEDLNTIVNWVMAGSSIALLNKKLKDKYNHTLDDVELEAVVPDSSATAPGGSISSTFPEPEEIHSSVAVKPASSAPHSRSNSAKNGSQLLGRMRTDSVTSDVGSVDGMEEQMNNMRRITSGQYEQLGKQVRAFYRRYDPAKVDNKEALDLVMKWTFKHGPEALNKQFEKNYGKALFSVVIDENDEEAEEADDIVDAPPEW